MNNNQAMEMSKVIGQIEDELRSIKSAKEQAEAVIGSNKALSDSLQALFDSSTNMAKALDNNVQQIIAEINNKIEMLNIQAADIESYAQQGVSKISEQYSLAQLKLEDELGNLVQKLTDFISASTNQSLEAIGKELTGYRVLVHEAAKKFTDSTSDTIARQEGQIAEIGKLVACTHERQYALDAKIEELRQLDIMRLFDEISEIRKQDGQIAEIGKLVACIHERQYALDAKIEELRQLDIMRLFDEISEIRKIESANATATKKWRVVENSAFGACLVLGIAILIRLLFM